MTTSSDFVVCRMKLNIRSVILGFINGELL